MDYQKLEGKKLEEAITKLRDELRDLRFDIKSQNLESLSDYRKKKKELAQALTVKTEKKVSK